MKKILNYIVYFLFYKMWSVYSYIGLIVCFVNKTMMDGTFKTKLQYIPFNHPMFMQEIIRFL